MPTFSLCHGVHCDQRESTLQNGSCSSWSKIMDFLKILRSGFFDEFFHLFRHPCYIWRIILDASLDFFFLAITFLIITIDFKQQYSFGCWCIGRIVSSISQSWSNLLPRIELATRGKTGQMLWLINCTKLSLSHVSKSPNLVKLWAPFHRQNPPNLDCKVIEVFQWDCTQKSVPGIQKC